MTKPPQSMTRLSNGIWTAVPNLPLASTRKYIEL